MEPERADYLPAGSLKIPKEESNISPQLWSLNELRIWRSFVPPNVHQVNPNEPWLREDVQRALLSAPMLKNYEIMHRSWFIKLEFRILSADSDHGTLRVYLHPDDRLNWSYRSNPDTRANRKSMISSLDFSGDAWNGIHTSPRLEKPPLFQGYESIDNERDPSLLLLFNKIPSPMPDPDLVIEPHSHDVMCDLLDSNVPGLKSKLYPYQRRSVAVMFQKEIQPERIPDPRFMHVTDQNGSGWYLDPVEGGLLKEPRYYDGVSGGMLAEEMGSGKTIICLALILATKTFPSKAPEIYSGGALPVRKRLASLTDMAASCATRNGVPWKPYFDKYNKQLGEDFTRCTEALERNPGHYFVTSPGRERARRHLKSVEFPQSKKVFLSSGSVVIVPNNLVAQWKQEIRKHTQGLQVLVVVKGVTIPAEEGLLKYDLILFSQTRFEMIAKQPGGFVKSPLHGMHFKRCIIDEGHKLGNSKINRQSNLLIGLNALKFSSRWVVTGTPSQGLFGVDLPNTVRSSHQVTEQDRERPLTAPQSNESILEMEKKDLERIGSIATLFLKARPWANVGLEHGDQPAEWNVYLMLPKHNPKGHGRWDCLRSTLNSLIVRHRLSDVGDLLPPVSQKVVILDGSYQDQLSINIFSMMIIFNTVQSQRTDRDYFFHPKQRRSLLEIVTNLKQACFFGGSFFTHQEIVKAVETAEKFLREKKVTVSAEDEKLLREAIKIGHIAMGNKLRELSSQFHELPVAVEDLPAVAAQSWSLDGEPGNSICSSATMLLALQRLVFKSATDPTALNSLLNGQLIEKGIEEREKMRPAQPTEKDSSPKVKGSKTLAGNTKLGADSPKKKRSHGVNGVRIEEQINKNTFLGPLETAKITSTVSAKLSYLIDSLLRYQDQEKIIVFYENDNVAWYLSAMLDVVRIQHLIYAKSLSASRKAEYINTFHENPTFRVLLMDITQAAFGLDMREASRIYFINPVLNPQVEAQAIGRLRRISQKKPVTVETLVLRNSIEEIILERKTHMTQAEHRQVRSILDVRPIYDWIKYPKLITLPEGQIDNRSQMTPLDTPQYIFGRGFGRIVHPNDGIVRDDHVAPFHPVVQPTTPLTLVNGRKRALEADPGEHEGETQYQAKRQLVPTSSQDPPARPRRKVRFTAGDDETDED